MLLKTKLYPPKPLDSAIPRRNLINQLDDAEKMQKHILISAGAGFGKSTLLAQWVEHQKIHPAWISLDEQDNEPGRFYRYLAAALQQRYRMDTESVESLLKERPSVNFQLLLELFADLILQCGEPVHIVLDDLHLIENPQIVQGIEFLMKHCQGSCSFIFLTRIDPQISLSKLRLEQKLHEIREADLRFSDDEIRQMVTDNGLNGKTNALIELLSRKTEGWIVGLQLALLAWKQEKGEQQFVERFSGAHAFVADYLMEEVLNGFDQDTERLLLAASLFRRFNSDLLESVLGCQTRDPLNRLKTSHFFLISLDDEQNWFRYHHLVGELLKKRACEKWRKEELKEYMKKASCWFENHGLIDEAVFTIQETGQTEELIRLISTHGLKRIAAGELHTVSNWLKLLPEQKLYSTPDLCVISGWIASIEQDFENQKFISEQAESVFDENSPYHIPDIKGHLALLKANHLIQDPATRPEDIRSLLISAEENIQSDNLLLKSILELYRGNFYRMVGELSGAQEAHKKTMIYADQLNDFSLMLPACTASCEILMLQGKFQEAEQILLQILDKLYRTFKTVRIPKVGLLHILLGMIYYEQNRLDESMRELQKAEKISQSTNDYNALVMYYDIRAKLHLLHHELDDAQKNLDAAIELSEKRHLLYYSAYLVHLTFMIRKQHGSRIALEQCLDMIKKNDLGFGLWLGQLELTRIKTLIALERFQEALQDAEQLKKKAAKREARYVEFQTDCLLAFLQWKLQNHTKCFVALHQVLQFAAKSSAWRPILDIGPGMTDPIKKLASDKDSIGKVSPDVLKQLLNLFEQELNRTPEGLSAPLSERELEVLRLVSSGLSNKEIGEQLFLALGTVKKHSYIIYQKLGVKNRIQAVEKARELRVI